MHSGRQFSYVSQLRQHHHTIANGKGVVCPVRRRYGQVESGSPDAGAFLDTNPSDSCNWATNQSHLERTRLWLCAFGLKKAAASVDAWTIHPPADSLLCGARRSDNSVTTPLAWRVISRAM